LLLLRCVFRHLQYVPWATQNWRGHRNLQI
jgi:hypothetical protein